MSRAFYPHFTCVYFHEDPVVYMMIRKHEL